MSEGPEEPVDPDLLAEFFNEKIPFQAHLGLKAEVVRPGQARGRLPFRPEFVGDPFRPALHGGLLATVADSLGGVAVASLMRRGDRASTIDLRVDYLRPGRCEDVVIEAEVIRIGNRVAVTSISLHHDGDDEPIALCKAVFNVRRGAPE